MANPLDNIDNAQPTKITGADENVFADVKTDSNGNERLFVNASIVSGGPDGLVTLPKITYLLDGSTKNMNVDGSVTPVVYEFAPSGTDIFFINGVSILILDPGKTEADKFGSITALTNGLQLKVKTNGGTETEITNIQDNTDLTLTFNSDITLSNGAGDNWLNDKDWFKGTYQLDPIVQIDANQGDTIKIIVRDDLTEVKILRVLVHAWKVQ